MIEELQEFTPEKMQYLRLLAQQFPSEQAVCTEIINLTAIQNLPKGTELFMSDIHGESEAFEHIMNNCSGVIREKVLLALGKELSKDEINAICTLIYYPAERLEFLEKDGKLSYEWYKTTLTQLIRVARTESSKYTRSKVRKQLKYAGIPCLTSLDTAEALADIIASRYKLDNTELVDINNM